MVALGSAAWGDQSASAPCPDPRTVSHGGRPPGVERTVLASCSMPPVVRRKVQFIDHLLCTSVFFMSISFHVLAPALRITGFFTRSPKLQILLHDMASFPLKATELIPLIAVWCCCLLRPLSQSKWAKSVQWEHRAVVIPFPTPKRAKKCSEPLHSMLS